MIEIEPLPGKVGVEGYDWVVVTSPNGARELVGRASGPLPRVAAVGPGTAEALRELGVEPALVPRVSSQDGLLAEFPRMPVGFDPVPDQAIAFIEKWINDGCLEDPFVPGP